MSYPQAEKSKKLVTKTRSWLINKAKLKKSRDDYVRNGGPREAVWLVKNTLAAITVHLSL